jgi:hypothetical protein
MYDQGLQLLLSVIGPLVNTLFVGFCFSELASDLTGCQVARISPCLNNMPQ